MEPFLSDYLVLFQNLTLPGFFYLIGLLVIIQAYTKIEIITLIKENKMFWIYIGILVIIFSFIIGLVAHLVVQEVKSLLLKLIDENLFDDIQRKCSADKEAYMNLYGVLIMFRHLIFSICFVIFSIALYLIRRKKRLNNRGFFTVMYAIVILLLSLAYFKIREVFLRWSIGDGSYWIYIIIALCFLVPLLYYLYFKLKFKN